MVNSGRASYIAKGKYSEIYKAAYNLRPGDFVAYEKNGRITHISTVTGLDSKGYPLVTCHNTDRLLVPFDLGWSNDNIRFHLIDVYYWFRYKNHVYKNNQEIKLINIMKRISE